MTSRHPRDGRHKVIEFMVLRQNPCGAPWGAGRGQAGASRAAGPAHGGRWTVSSDGAERSGVDGRAAATIMAPLLGIFFPHGVPVRFEFWDGSAIDGDTSAGTAVIASPDALRRLIWAPGGARARTGVRERRPGPPRRSPRGAADARGAASGHDVGWRQLPVVLDAARPPASSDRRRSARRRRCARGRRHSRRHDARAIGHHYDVGNAFYRLLLGPSMTYSCARFATPETGLDDAQVAKLDLICRKLGLRGGPSEAAARRRVRVGLAGDACGRPLRRDSRRGDDQRRAGGHGATASTLPGWPTASRSGSGTTASCTVRRSTSCRPWACSSTSDRSGWRSISASYAASWLREGACSTTRSRRSEVRGSRVDRSSGGTSSPTAS